MVCGGMFGVWSRVDGVGNKIYIIKKFLNFYGFVRLLMDHHHILKFAFGYSSYFFYIIPRNIIFGKSNAQNDKKEQILVSYLFGYGM